MNLKAKFYYYIKLFFGLPSLTSLKDFFKLLLKLRLMFFIYLFLILLYVRYFYWHKVETTQWLSNNFGKDFGVSFSASLLEDLVMFIFLSFALTVFSIKLSLIKPADYEFDDRIRAIMNSKLVAFDKRVFDFLKKEISLILAYNKLIQIEVEIANYFPDEDCFQFAHTRHQVITNMCKDKDFISSGSKISIYTHLKHNNSWGTFSSLEQVEPNNFNNKIKDIIQSPVGTELKEGENPLPLPYTIGSDDEFAYKLKYYVYTRHDLHSQWSFSSVFRYTTKMTFKITNKLPSGQSIHINLRRRDTDKEPVDILDRHVLHWNESYSHVEDQPFKEDDKIEFFVYPPFDK